MCFISFISSAQKTYEFNNILEYEYQKNKDSAPEIRLILTNSNSNHYYVLVSKLDEENYELEFRDRNGLETKVEISVDDFFKAEILNVSCSDVYPYSNRYKFRTKEYDFHDLKDTLQGNTTYAFFELKHNDKKVEEKKNLGRLYYIMEKDTQDHMPTFLHATAYEEWKREKSAISGIFKARYFIDHEGEIVGSYHLKNIHEVTKYLSINGNCDHIIN